MVFPSLEFEQQYMNQGYKYVAGIDEVGVGCLAGPVVAASVILDPQKTPKGIRDSKLLTAKRREELSKEIRATAIGFCIASASVEKLI